MSSPVDDNPVIAIPGSDVKVYQVTLRLSASEPTDSARPHAFQRLKRLEGYDDRDPYWAEVITESEFLSASEFFGVEQAIAAKIRFGQVSYARAIHDGLWARVRAWLDNYDPVDIEPGQPEHPFPTAEPLIVGELHCPPVEGAVATFESSHREERRIGLDLTAAGFGGGGWTRKRIYANESRFGASAHECKVICAYLSGHYEVWRHLPGTKPPLILVNVTGIDSMFADSIKNVPDREEFHLCERANTFDNFMAELAAGHLVANSDYNQFKTPAGAASPAWYWETTREYSGKWGFEAKYGGIELTGGVSFTSTFTDTVKVSVTCPGGYHYIGRFRSARELPQQWGVAALT